MVKVLTRAPQWGNVVEDELVCWTTAAEGSDLRLPVWSRKADASEQLMPMFNSAQAQRCQLGSYLPRCPEAALGYPVVWGSCDNGVANFVASASYHQLA